MTQKNGITEQRKRNTKLAMEQYRTDNLNRILTSTLVTSGDPFTVADMVVYLSRTAEVIPHGIVAGYLGDLYNSGNLSMRAAKPGAKSGAKVYSRKPSQALRMKWRTRTNAFLEIMPMPWLGVPQ